MQAGEEEHLATMERLLRERRVRPSALLPVWRAAGFALGLVTGMMGKASAMAATVAVETSISTHYNDQVRQLLLRAEPEQQQPLQPLQQQQQQQQRAAEDAELLRIFSKHRDEEMEHHDEALSQGAATAPGFEAIKAVISTGCAAAITVAKRI
jgi:ubiquinone biosynthesis monooxygenase Coq7